MNPIQEYQEQIGRIEGLLGKLESADPSTRATARDLVQCVMDLHGAGLGRVLEIMAEANASPALMQSLAHDPLVSSLLVLYNLHPEEFEVRVRRALDKVRPGLRSRDVRVDAVEITGETVRILLVGPVTNDLKGLVREALYETAPDATEVEIEGGRPQAPAGFVPLASLLSSASKPQPASL